MGGKFHRNIHQNVDEYISPPKLPDISSYIKAEKENNNIARLIFLDLSTRKVGSSFVGESPNLRTDFNLHYPDGFDEVAYSKTGVVYVDEYGTAYFSPLTITQLKTEIRKLKQDMSQSLKEMLLRVFSKLEKRYAPIAQIQIRFDNNLGAYVGSIDIGTKKPLGIFVSPWVLWVEERYCSEIHYDLEYIKKNIPCVIITTDKIRPSVIRKAIIDGYTGISFISITDAGNYLLSIGPMNEIVSELLPVFTDEGFFIKDITEKILSKMFPFTKEDIFDFANMKFTKNDLMELAKNNDIALSRSMLKDDILQRVCDHIGLRRFAEIIGYPLFDREITEDMPPQTKGGHVPRPQVPMKVSRLPLQRDDTGDTIVVGSTEFPKQWGIIGRSEGKRVIIDLNAPHIVFVSGMMGTGKGYTIGVISEMLVSKEIPNLSDVTKNATIIVLYKPRDDVPSEFWSIRYPNDVQREIDGLSLFNAQPMAPITEGQFRVFLDPLVYTKSGDAFKSEYKTSNIYPLFIDPSTLRSEDWAIALATGGSSDALYIKRIFKILRKLPADFSMEDIINSIKASDLTEAQKGFARARLEILDEYLKKDDFVNKLILGGVNIIDFRKVMYMPDDIFTIMTLIISKLQNKKEFEDEPFVFIMNEAHLYFKKGIAKEFVESIENLIRRKRHGANWLLLDTHLPDDVDSKVIELSDIKILHFTDKTVDSPVLKRILEGTDEKLFRLNTGEAIVCANLSSLGLSVSIRVQIRPRVSKHGAATKTAK